MDYVNHFQVIVDGRVKLPDYVSAKEAIAEVMKLRYENVDGGVWDVFSGHVYHPRNLHEGEVLLKQLTPATPATKPQGV